MRHLAQKLKSRHGASMLFALLVFLLCLLAGVTALTAVAANAGRYTHLEEQQQQYFSVASALGLLQDDLDALVKKDPNGPFTVKATCVETQSWWYEPDGYGGYTPKKDPETEPKREINLDPTITSPINGFQYLLLQNSLPAEWQTALSHLSHEELPTTEQTFKISLEPDDPELTGTVKPVNVKVKCHDYTLEMELSTEDSNAYPLKVVWSGKANVTTETKTETTGDIADPPLANPSDPDSKGTRTTTITLTATLDWSAENRVVTFG